MTKKELRLVADAGHAGFNATAGKRTPAGEYEWDFNNVVVKAMLREIEKYEGVKTLRVDDSTGKRDVPLRERTDLANNWNGNLFVSVHHNANTGRWGEWTGTETYTFNGSRPDNAESEKLAKIANDGIVDAYKLRNRGLKKANFHILREAKMPVVLTEGGYMDSNIDIKVMRDTKALEQSGINIAQGIAKHYGLKLKPVAKPVIKPSTSAQVFYRVQVGAFKDIAGVAKYAKQVEDKTKFATYITEVDGWLKVQVGAFTEKAGADKRLEAVVKAGYKDAFITTKSGSAVAIAEPQNDPEIVVERPKPVAKKAPAPAKPVAKPVVKKFNLPTKNYWHKTPQFNGNDVRIIQEALCSVNFFPEKGAKNNGVDGWFGAKTADALRRFQTMHGLKADGIYGAKTREKLNSLVNK